MAGGRSRFVRSRPGNTSVRDEKNTVNPSVKKFGESPGLEKMSRGTWKCRSPIWTNVSDSNSWDSRRGTIGSVWAVSETRRGLTAVELRVCEQPHKVSSIPGLYMVPWGC